MLKTASGRGYRLLGTWTSRQDGDSVESVDFESTRRLTQPSLTNLPVAVSDLIGRTTAVRQLQDLLSAYRTVTLTGPGGIGKTALALEVARSLFPTYEGDRWVIDLVSVSDPGLVPSAVAGVLSLRLGGTEISPDSVARAIRGKRLLLLLDNCEHVVDAVAGLAEAVLRVCPQVSILATSRELLRIEGEHVYRVPSLEVPPQHWEDLHDMLRYSAVELFIARTQALHSDFSARDEILTAIANICRRLDGIPLAIEFAAARAAAIGVRQVASHLDDRFRLLTSGRRRALPRHRTLRATLDWSYELLPDSEKCLLRRLAIFVAGFTLDEATAIMSNGDDDTSAVLEGIAKLVEKSLVALDGSAPDDRWQLVETIRAYGLERLTESGEAELVSRRHAEFYCALFEQQAGEWEMRPTTADGFVRFGENLANVRAALEWSFSERGDIAIGTALADASARFFLERSLLIECYRWTSRAIAALDCTTIGTRREMELQTALGVSMMFTQGSTEVVATAFARGAELAETVDDPDCQRRFLSGFYLYLTRTRDFHGALTVGKRMKAAGVAAGDPNIVMMADWMVGVAYHNIGDQAAAYACCESARTQQPASRWHNIIWFGGHDYRISALIVAARALWLLGNPDKAVTCAIYSIKEAELLEHPLLICTSMLYAAHLYLWMGDWPSAEEMIRKTAALAIKNSFSPFQTHTFLLNGALLIKRGESESGIQIIRSSFDTTSGDRYTVMNTVFLTALAEGLAIIGEFDGALTAIDRAIDQVGSTGESFDMPEMLRVKAEIIWRWTGSGPSNAEKWLLQSLDCARKQSALGWELRTAISLARLWSEDNRAADALALLAPLYARYTEGLESGDLQAARNLLNELGHSDDP
jgi:predicted ATPase